MFQTGRRQPKICGGVALLLMFFHMNDDPTKKALVMSRRQALLLLGITGAAVLAGRSNVYTASDTSTAGKLPACILTPKQTEGPYFVDEQLKRSDIRVDPGDGSVKSGAPLTLALRVSSINNAGCTPVPDAIMDIWHCDAAGAYSDVTDPGFRTVGKKFLRGYQVTDTNGTVRFTTIYPGWYRGRTVHIHFKVRAKARSGKTYELTSQLYFDDALTDRVHTQRVYGSKGQRTRNNQDGLFRNGGRQLMLSVAETRQGYAATFDVGLQMV